MNHSIRSNQKKHPLMQRFFSSGSSFPVRILTVAVIITLLLFTIFGLQFWNSYRELKTTQTFYLRLQELVGIIFHYDEVLTMSARLGAATGNPEWEQRYREYEPQLDATIKETIELSPEIFMSKAAIETNTSNIQLVTMENRAFELIRRGQGEAAMDLLFSEEYEKHKVIYSKGMEQINSTIQERVKGALKTQRQRSLAIVTFAVITMLILLLAWFAIVRLIRSYVIERRKSEEALQESHNELEKKVDDRTADLQLSNTQLKQEIIQRKETEKELRDSEERFQTLVETANDAIFIADAETGIILNANKQAGELLGLSPENIVGMHQTQFHSKEDADHYGRIFKEHVQRGKGVIVEDVFVCRKNGQKIPTEVSASVTDFRGKKIILGIFRDITDRKKAEVAIKEAKEFLESVIENSRDGIAITDAKGHILSVNTALVKMCKYTKAELIGEHSSILTIDDKELRQSILKKSAELLENGFAFYEAKHKAQGGGYIDVECNTSMIKDADGNYIAGVAIIRDISERKEAERQLMAYQEQLKSLTAKITLTEEQERKRFAGFLHDEIGQQLFAVQLQLELLKSTLSSADNIQTLNSTINNINNVISHSRSLTRELSSPILNELGLEKALEWLAEQAHKKYGIKVTFNDDKRKKPLDDAVKIFSYQAVRELLTNVAKHARVKTASVSVKEANSTIQISVEDNGVGFDPSSKHLSNDKAEGFGLFQMKERLDQLGGYLTIESKLNHGTRITLIIPLKSSL